ERGEPRHGNLPERAVCDTMTVPSPAARRPSAGAVPGRCGACLAVRTAPAAFHLPGAGDRLRTHTPQNVHRAVAVGGGQVPAVGAEGDVMNSASRLRHRFEAVELFARLNIPDAHGGVPGAGNRPAAVRGERHAGDGTHMPREAPQLPAAVHVPKQYLVAAAG